jgi:uncharacterized protein
VQRRVRHRVLRDGAERCAEVHHVGGSGVNALHLAASRGFEPLSRLLLARGVDRLARTEDGKTASEIARERGHLGIAAMLELAD